MLKDKQSVRQPSYQVPECLLPVLKAELDMMLQRGIIEPSFSKWSSPNILVPKKDGGFCLEFRKVNAQTKFDSYPMPRMLGQGQVPEHPRPL